MIYPKIVRSKSGDLTYLWRSTRSGFRYSTKSAIKFLMYPFSRVAWNSRAIYRDSANCKRALELEYEKRMKYNEQFFI